MKNDITKLPNEEAMEDYNWKKKKKGNWGFRGGAVVGNPPASAGKMGSSPGPGGSHVPQSN